MAKKKSFGTSVKEFFKGTPESTMSIPTMDKSQMGILNQLEPQVMQGLQQQQNQPNPLQALQNYIGQQSQQGFQPQQLLNQLLGNLQNNSFDFAPFEQQARTDFQQKTIPSILERFNAMGSNSDSSGLRRDLGAASSGLETGLGQLRGQFGLQQQGLQQELLKNLLGAQIADRGFMGNLLGQGASLGLQQQGQGMNNTFSLLSALMQPRFQSVYSPAQPGAGSSILGGLGRLGTAAASAYFNPAGFALQQLLK